MSLAIIDLSSMFHRLWHVDKDNVTHKIISFLKTLQHDKVIIAVDSPPYKRKEMYPGYKANRDVPDPELIGCLKNTQNKVYSEGFKIAKSEGWEADDVIGTIINEILDKGDNLGTVTVFGSDKDLLQITALTDPFTNEIRTPEDRLGVTENQVVDYLALIGDNSDNIKGVPGVGEKTAQALLKQFGSIDGIYKAIKETPEKFTKPSILKSLQESEQVARTAMKVIALNCMAPIEYLQKEVVKQDMEEIVLPEEDVKSTTEVKENPRRETAMVLRTEPVEYKKSLEPIGMQEAWKIATVFDRSGLYPRFKGPEQVLMTIMRGRELGLGATTSLELIDMIQGKPTMKAAGMSALVMQRKDVCEYIYCAEMDDAKATWVTKRVNIPREISRTFTIEDAKKMDFVVDGVKTVIDKFGNKKEVVSKDNWVKQPAVMLQWRACSQLIRQVYPDLINGLYSTEEMIDG